jgi:two-component system LytT family response regulator
MFRVLIVDDEKPARQYVTKLLGQRPDFEIVGECRDAREAMELITREAPDLVILDIQMPGMTGLEMVSKIGTQKMPVTVFTTAYYEFAIKAFELHAVGYLLKPFTPQQFWSAIDHASDLMVKGKLSAKFNALLAAMMGQLQQLGVSGLIGSSISQVRSIESQTESTKYLTRINVPGPHKMSIVPVRDIHCLVAKDYYCQIKAGGKDYLVRESLDWFEKRLSPTEFVRVHRSTLVNVSFVKATERTISGQLRVVLTSGDCFLVSRRRRAELLSKLRTT